MPDPSNHPAPDTRDALVDAWDARVARLLPRLPDRLRRAVEWLLVPSRRWIRIVAGVALIAGGFLSILPVLGLWMLPLGLALIGEDSPAVKAALERATRWGERQVRRFRPASKR